MEVYDGEIKDVAWRIGAFVTKEPRRQEGTKTRGE